ncbi:NAD(P)-binding protein [Aspergillus ellipticus CBS 707.79]|uniref:NAD(P)-binding protein n=1 Tax=Aspergillus ellipticus CBS 707.79 TaxID=1448320 RepID=A0A319CYR0_9EURO|nr:NAD(P)-binding protein [Aspergillus ellipticus CBS 707.79]
MPSTTTLFPGVALITGAASGIGQATALSFAREGCLKIAICDKSAPGLAQTTAEITAQAPDTQIETIEVDVSDSGSVAAMMRRVVSRRGWVDYVVNAAGIQGATKRSLDLTGDEFDAVNGEPLATHDGRAGDRGSDCAYSESAGGWSGETWRVTAYCASKSAVMALARCDAIDYSRHNIRVNCVRPGLVETPMALGSPEQRKMFAPAVAIALMNRMGRPQEIADACLFLCSSKATFVQGGGVGGGWGGYTIV